MGYGGYVTLVNGSPYDWVLTSQHSYQMNTWSWPTISAGKSTQVYLEWGLTGSTSDDAGEAYYQLAGTSDTFQIQARNPKAYHIYVVLDGMSTENNARGSTIDEGFRHDQSVNFIMSTDEAGGFWSNSAAPVDWMQKSLGSIGNRTLKAICMPGSHDAGMTTFNPGTAGANFANTQTQILNIYDQLRYGSRFFDIRPVISDGVFVAGHYSEVGTSTVWLGGNGQSIADVISQVNQFTAQYQELLIINLSNALDTDNDYAALTQAQWNQLFEQLKGINNRFIMANAGDLTDLQLNQFIQGRASVLIVAQLNSGVTLGDYANEGFYSSSNFPMYNVYSNSNDATTMENDQLNKLAANRNLVANTSARKDQFFLLSWTLTQQLEDVANPDRAIMDLAASVWDDLYTTAYNAFTPESFPNVLYMDAYGIRDPPVKIGDSKPEAVAAFPDPAALAMAVNNGIASRNTYITG